MTADSQFATVSYKPCEIEHRYGSSVHILRDPLALLERRLGLDAMPQRRGLPRHLPPQQREAALKELFSPEGANFTLCRAPIGANDRFHNGSPNDYAKSQCSFGRFNGSTRDVV